MFGQMDRCEQLPSKQTSGQMFDVVVQTSLQFKGNLFVA